MIHLNIFAMNNTYIPRNNLAVLSKITPDKILARQICENIVYRTTTVVCWIFTDNFEKFTVKCNFMGHWEYPFTYPHFTTPSGRYDATKNDNNVKWFYIVLPIVGVMIVLTIVLYVRRLSKFFDKSFWKERDNWNGNGTDASSSNFNLNFEVKREIIAFIVSVIGELLHYFINISDDLYWRISFLILTWFHYSNVSERHKP